MQDFVFNTKGWAALITLAFTLTGMCSFFWGLMQIVVEIARKFKGDK